MKLSCPSCGAKYSIADEKVQDRLAKIRCRKCSATIIIDGKVSPPSIYTSDGAAAAPAVDAGDGGGGIGPGEYSVDFGDNDQRTMTAEEIVQALRIGDLSPEMYVWAEGMSDWTPIGDVPELSTGMNAPAPVVPAAPRAAARTGGGRGSAQDLFGGIETAGSEEDVMTSAAQPPSPLGGASAGGAATGARNESSVLFSLSALTASATTSSPPAARSSYSAGLDPNGKDDSGIIDLKALTSAVSAQSAPNPLTLGSLGGAPLGLGAPLGGITAPALSADSGAKSTGSKTGLYIAGALVVVGALIAGAIVFTSNKEPLPVAAAPVAPVPTVAAVAAAPQPAAAPEAPAAEPPATGTAAASAAPVAAAAAPAASRPKSTSAAAVAYSKPAKKSSSSSSSSSSGSDKSSGSSSSSSSSNSSAGNSDSTPKPPPKKKAKTCDCAPSDLMCAMKCAAG